MFPLGHLAPLAVRQLAAWEDIARGWPSRPDADGKCQRCQACGVALYRLADDAGRPYRYGPGQVLAQTVAHLRQAHAELDPDLPEHAGEALCLPAKPMPGGYETSGIGSSPARHRPTVRVEA